MESAVIVNNVSKSFKIDKPHGISARIKEKFGNKKDLFLALDGISFEVKKGEVFGIIGLNGSGKTTLLRIISGIYTPEQGSVQVNGKLSSLLQLGAGFQGEFNAKENIIMNGMLLGLSKSQIKNKVRSIIKYAELEKFSELKIKNYSSGMKAKLAFATAMQVNPDILLVDEILAVGDKEFKNKSYETFLSFKKDNKTIIHSTHNLEKLSEFSDRVLLIHKGKKITIDEPKKVISRYMEIKSG